MTAPVSGRPRGASSILSGAAAGALALAAIAAAEIAFRGGAEPALASPLRDLSLLALGGACAGAALGAVRGAGLALLSPFGVTLGAAIALERWLAGVSGSGVLTGGVAHEALRGAALVLAGAAVGEAAGLALRKIPAPRASRRPLLHLAIVVALAAPALWPSAPAPPASSGSILLLTVDTLRADRLGCSGNPRPVSPNLDRLARRGVTFTRVVSPLPRTLPATASLHTGLEPQRHGVRDNFHYALAPAAATIAEDLAARGYACAAVSSNPVLSHASGIFQGFASANDRGDDWSRLGLVRGAGRVITLLAMRRGDRDRVVSDLALRWLLHERPGGRPFFLWVHWLAPHMPYEPAYPFDRRFDPGYDGEFRYSLGYDTISKGDMTYRNPLTPRERLHAVALYDGEVATSDRAVGRLLRGMESAGLLRGTRVVFTADHGESLLEHGYFFNHGDFVYGPAADVPLLLAGDDGPERIDDRPLSLADLRNTLIEGDAATEAAVEPDRPLFGESGFCRFPDLNDRLGYQLPLAIAQSPDVVTDWRERWEAQADRAKQRFVERGRWKLVRSPREDGDREELFDLDADPGETADVSAAHPDTVAALDALLDDWVAQGETSPTTAAERTLDEDAREQMDALGYLGK